jgi:phosphoribosylformylglycinamidine (FGAM) synthase-like enzyme
MAARAIDECVRNLVCVGADPPHRDPRQLLLAGCTEPRAARRSARPRADGCYDLAIAYRTPFVSGKDSLNNQFTTEMRPDRRSSIPPTLL